MTGPAHETTGEARGSTRPIATDMRGAVAVSMTGIVGYHRLRVWSH